MRAWGLVCQNRLVAGGGGAHCLVSVSGPENGSCGVRVVWERVHGEERLRTRS